MGHYALGLKVTPAKQYFSNVCHWYNLLRCFLFHVIIERQYFLYKFFVSQWFDATAMLLCFLKQVFEVKQVLERSPHLMSIISTMTLQCWQYQRSKVKLFKLSKRVYLLLVFLSHSFILKFSEPSSSFYDAYFQMIVIIQPWSCVGYTLARALEWGSITHEIGIYERSIRFYEKFKVKLGCNLK